MQSFYLKEFLKTNAKFQKPEDLLKHLDAILDISKNDVRRLAGFCDKFFADFDWSYRLACDEIKLTLSKTSLSAFKRILSCGDLEKAAGWLISRLLNNMVNLTVDTRYKRCVDMRSISIVNNEDKIYGEDETLKNLEIEDSIEKLSEDELKAGLKKAYNNGINGSLDLSEVEELCWKYNLNLTEILGYDPYEAPEMGQEQAKSGNSQLVLIFS